MKKAIGILIIIAFFLSAVVLIVLLLSPSGDAKYYEYRDLAVSACEGGDMKSALRYIETAIQYAEDLDLVGEGLHYKMLFEHNMCEE